MFYDDFGPYSSVSDNSISQSKNRCAGQCHGPPPQHQLCHTKETKESGEIQSQGFCISGPVVCLLLGFVSVSWIL